MTALTPYGTRLLAQRHLHWRLGFNDPNIIAWLTVAGYAAAMVLTWRAADRARKAGRKFDGRFWLASCAAMALLGINKQFDLHVLITDLGREWAIDHGWYQQRRVFQEGFMLAVAGGAVLVLARVESITRRKNREIRWAFGGMILVALYVLIRAASFHHTDVLMRTTVFGHRWNWVIEIAGIAVVGYAAWRYCRRGR